MTAPAVTVPPVRAWAVVPDGGTGTPVLVLDLARADQIAVHCRGLVTRLRNDAAFMADQAADQQAAATTTTTPTDHRDPQ